MNTQQFIQSLLGLCVFPMIALLFALGERRFAPRIWAIAILMQFLLALILLKVPWFQYVFVALNQAVTAIQSATAAGTSLVFGYLGGADLPFEEISPGQSYILAFRALPLILVVGALTALLSYWRVLPWIIRLFAKVFSRSLNIGGAVAVAGAANIFVGMIEAPLFIRNSVKRLSQSELFMVMTVGMATVAGTVLILYATILEAVLPDAVGHIFTASIISVPAAILMATLMVPYDGKPTPPDAEVSTQYHGAIDAVAQGGISAMQILLNIIALLICFIALVHLSNLILANFPDFAGHALSLERILGWLMAPIVWLMGIPWSEATTAGQLMGIKTVLNELLAFLKLTQLPTDALSQNSVLIMTYALCGFANFGSLGILIGGLSTLAPERRNEITRLGLLSIVSGTLATCMTASVVGVISSF